MKLRQMLFAVCIVLLLTPWTLSAAQDATPETTAAPEALTERFAAANGVLSFQYPAGWLVVDEGMGAVLFNRADIDVTTTMLPGQVFMVVDSIDKGEFAGLNIEPTPLGFLQLLAEFSDVPVQNPTPFIFADGRLAAVGAVPGESEDGLIIVVDASVDTLVYLSAVSAPGTITTYAVTIRAIAETIRWDDAAMPETTPDAAVLPQLDVTAEAGSAPQVNIRAPLTELAPALPLPAQYATADGALAFNYPDGWRVLERIGVVAIANSAATETTVAANQPLTGGQFSMGIYLPAALRDFMEIDVTAAPVEVLIGFVQATSGQTIPAELLRAFTVGGRAAVRLDIGGTTTDGVIMAVPLGNGQTVIVTLAAAPGEAALFEATALAMVESMMPGGGQVIAAATPIPNVTAANLTQTFAAATSGLRFNYPLGWEARESSGTVILVNTSEFFTATALEWGAGQFGMIIYTPAFLGTINVVDNGDLNAALIAFLAASGSTEGYSLPASVNAPGLTILRTDSSSGATQRTVWALRLPNNTLLIVEGVAGTGQLAQFEPTMLAVLSTAVYGG